MTTPASAAEPTPPHLTPVPEAGEFLAFVESSPVLDEVEAQLDRSPANFLLFASMFAGSMPYTADAMAIEVGLKTRRVVRAIAAAASHFRRRGTVTATGIDLPGWITDIDDTEITKVRSRRRGRVEDWLLEAIMPGGHRLAAHLVIESNIGALNDAYVTDGTIRNLQKRMTKAGSGSASFKPVPVPEAADRLVDALGRYRASVGDSDPTSQWPANEELVTWLIATLLHQGGLEKQAA